MMKLFLPLIFLFMACSGEVEKEEEIKPVYQENEDVMGSGVTMELIEVEGGYGYRILMDGKPYITQPHIPAVQGNRPFQSEDEAASVAALVIEKIEEGIIPPSITIPELEELGVEIER